MASKAPAQIKMPDNAAEIEKRFELFMEEKLVGKDLREKMSKLPLAKKWDMLCQEAALEQSNGAWKRGTEPKFWVQVLSHPGVKAEDFHKFHAVLRSQGKRWLSQFVGLNGLTLITHLLIKPFPPDVRLEILKCLKYIGNTDYGVNQIASTPEAVEEVAGLLATAGTYVLAKEAIEILTVICWVSEEGHTAVVHALSTPMFLPRRFAVLVSALTMTGDGDIEYRTAVLTFINALINAIQAIEVRAGLRSEFVELGLVKEIDKIRKHIESRRGQKQFVLMDHAQLSVQCDVFEEAMDADEQETSFNNLNLADIDQVWNSVRHRAVSSGKYSNLLHILHDLLTIPVPAPHGRGPPASAGSGSGEQKQATPPARSPCERMWSGVQYIVHVATNNDEHVDADEAMADEEDGEQNVRSFAELKQMLKDKQAEDDKLAAQNPIPDVGVVFAQPLTPMPVSPVSSMGGNSKAHAHQAEVHLSPEMEQKMHEQTQRKKEFHERREKDKWQTIRTNGLPFAAALSDAIAMSPNNIPRPMFESGEYIKAHGLRHEGVFRIPGKQGAQHDIAEAFQKGEAVALSDVDDVASVLKLYLRKMREPLIPFSSYPLLIEAAQSKSFQTIDKIKSHIDAMPTENRECLQYLCGLLSEVSSHTAQNKMDSKNLSIVIGPNILRPPVEDPKILLADSPRVVLCVQILIDSYAVMFPEPFHLKPKSKEYMASLENAAKEVLMAADREREAAEKSQDATFIPNLQSALDGAADASDAAPAAPDAPMAPDAPSAPTVKGLLGAMSPQEVARQFGLPEKVEVRPSTRMRGVYWQVVQPQDVSNTIWKLINDESLIHKLDVSMLEAMFALKDKPKVGMGGPADILKEANQPIVGTPASSSALAAVDSGLLPAAHPSHPVAPHPNRNKVAPQLVDQKRAMMGTIVLKNFNDLSFDDVRNAFIRLDDAVLPEERLSRLTSILPSRDELQVIANFVKANGDVNALNDVERFYVTIHNVPFLEQRAKTWMFKQGFDDRVRIIEECFAVFEASQSILESSERLRKVLEMVLAVGNYINAGTRNGAAYGFGINALRQLRGLKSNDGKMTLLEFVCDQVNRMCPDARNFIDDLAELEQAGKLKLKQETMVDINAIGEELTLVKQAVRKATETPSLEPNDQFLAVMGAFARAAQERLIQLGSRLGTLQDRTRRLAAFFGEDPVRFETNTKRAGIEEVISLFLTFRSEYIIAEKVVEKRNKKEARQERIKTLSKMQAKAARAGPEAPAKPEEKEAPVDESNLSEEEKEALRKQRVLARIRGGAKKAVMSNVMNTLKQGNVPDIMNEIQARRKAMNLKTMKKTMKTLRQKEINSELEARKLRVFVATEHKRNQEEDSKHFKAVAKKEAVEAKAVQFVAAILQEEEGEPGSEPGTPAPGVPAAQPQSHHPPPRSASVSVSTPRPASPGRDSVSPGRSSVSSPGKTPAPVSASASPSPAPGNAEQVARVAKLREAQSRLDSSAFKRIQPGEKGPGH